MKHDLYIFIRVGLKDDYLYSEKEKRNLTVKEFVHLIEAKVEDFMGDHLDQYAQTIDETTKELDGWHKVEIK